MKTDPICHLYRETDKRLSEHKRPSVSVGDLFQHSPTPHTETTDMRELPYLCSPPCPLMLFIYLPLRKWSFYRSPYVCKPIGKCKQAACSLYARLNTSRKLAFCTRGNTCWAEISPVHWTPDSVQQCSSNLFPPLPSANAKMSSLSAMACCMIIYSGPALSAGSVSMDFKICGCRTHEGTHLMTSQRQPVNEN